MLLVRRPAVLCGRSPGDEPRGGGAGRLEDRLAGGAQAGKEGMKISVYFQVHEPRSSVLLFVAAEFHFIVYRTWWF